MKFIVSAIKHAAEASDNLYYLLREDAKSLISVKSAFLLDVGDELELSNEEESSLSSGILQNSFSARVRKSEDPNLALRNASLFAESLLSLEPHTGIEEIDRINRKMLKALKDAASLFLTKLLIGSPVVVRFHNDSDGAAGAYCIFRSIELLGLESKSRFAWRMQRGVTYSKEDASADIFFINNFSSIAKPLLLVIDFGTTLESNAGIELAREKFDIIWLDHHPIIEGFKGLELKHYINPWMYGGDSDYTAGLLACTFSMLYANMDEKEVKEIQGASLIGDYSKFAQKDGAELSEILELITSDSRIINSKSVTPYEIESILANPARKDELLKYARLHLNEALDLAVGATKVYKGEKFNLYLLDFKHVRGEELKYPLPGRFASKLLSRIEELSDKPCMLILHFSSFISIRLSKGLDIDLLSLIKKAKEAFQIDSAGGHKNAVSIKLKGEDSKKDVIKFLLRELGFGYQP